MMRAASDRQRRRDTMVDGEKREAVKSAEEEELSRTDGMNMKIVNEIEQQRNAESGPCTEKRACRIQRIFHEYHGARRHKR